MKNLSIRLKITLWFSIILLVIVILTFAMMISVSGSVLHSTVRDNLMQAVNSNAEEIEYLGSVNSTEHDTSHHSDDENEHNSGISTNSDVDGNVYNPNTNSNLYEPSEGDHFLQFGSSYFEIDDDFLEENNGVFTSLYSQDGNLLYGENPVAEDSMNIGFSNASIQKLIISGKTYYIYDRQLSNEHLNNLWLRGIASDEQGTTQLSSITKLSLILLPLLLLLAIIGGFFIAGRTLKPIKKISDAAAQIEQGSDLDKRIDLGAGSDELHQMANTFDAMFDRLNKAFQNERQFTSDASHELRTPMAVIMAQCEYSLEKQRSVEEYESALQVIQRQGGKMNNLINDLLDFTRLENTENFKPEDVNLSELTASVCDDMALIKDKGITLTQEIAESVHVSGSHDLLVRLLTNMISNAYRYGTENGHIKVTLKKSSEIISGDTNSEIKTAKKINSGNADSIFSNKIETAELSVADDGIGIDSSDLEKIFSRFYKADSSHNSEGTGLGLSMVREIAHLHGGNVTVTSKKNDGSVFTFTLPLI